MSELNERVVNIGLGDTNHPAREKHRHEFFNILRNSYSSPELGGYGGHKSGSDEEHRAIHDDISKSKIKATKRDGKITTVALYKDQHGRKLIAGGTDGTPQGKADFKKARAEDITHKDRHSWAEVSGKLTHIMNNMGSPKVPSSHAAHLTGKKILATSDDGHEYTRDIAGHPHAKRIYGHPKI